MKKAIIFFLVLTMVSGFSTYLYGQDQSGGTCCGQACSPPHPSPPGGDHPDETFSVDSGNPPIQPFFTSDPHSVVLTNGNYDNLISLLSYAKKSATKADIYTPASDLLASSPVFVIPSGGLYGMENSAFFKGALEEFVKAGGTLIVFAQQHGYEFSILPVPQETDGSYRQINGYGWTEDQACFANAAYIDTWHPILAGQSRSTPTLNVDGYFTVYPSTATILLRRTASSYPAMLMYKYGLGRVIVTSLYSDYAFGHSQASSDSEEIALVRDMVLWATVPAQLPEIKRGETVTVQVPVTNLATTAAASAKVYISTPSKSSVVSEKVPISLAAGQSSTIPVSYTAPSNAALGIYPVEYELFDSQGNIVQPRAEARSGHFAISQPPGTAYRPGSTYQIWVTTPTDHVGQGSDVTFTIHIKNNTSTDLLNAQIGIGSHEEGSEGGRWWVYREALQGIDVAAGQTVETQWMFRIDISQSIYFGLFRSDQNPNTSLVGGGLARAERGVWIIKPSVKLSVQTDQTHYRRGETVNLSINIQNLTKSAYTTKLTVRVSDPSNVSVYNTEMTINLSAEGTSDQNTSFSLPLMAPLGFYTVTVEAYDTKGNAIGGDNTGFDLPKLFLSFTPILPSVLTANNSISFNIENKGVIPVSSAVLSVSLRDPTGGEIWNNQAQVSTLQSGESAIFDFVIPIEGIVFGEYKLVYSLSYEGHTNNGEHIISSIPVIKLIFDKPSYKIRETANLTAEVTAGKIGLSTVTETVSVPDLSYTDARTISFSPAQGSQNMFPIPILGTVTAGQHNVQVTLTLPSGSSMTQSSQITIPESSLIIQYSGATALKPGDTVNLTIENTGGLDTNYNTEKLSLFDSKGIAIYQGSASGSILAGEKKQLTSFQVPSQAADAYTLMGIQVRDSATSKLSTFYKVLDINGIAVTLQTKTSKDTYLDTEAITAISNVASGQFSMDGGSLKVAVSSSRESVGGNFLHFLPSKGWGFFSPEGLAVGPDGSVYVADDWESQIQKLDSSGNFLTRWGSEGSGDGQFHNPNGVAVGPDGFVYVIDTWNHRIQKLDKSGNFLAKWGSYGTGDSQFNYPYGVAVGPDGSVYVADTCNFRIQKFDSSGKFLTKWGSQGIGDGQFGYVYYVAVGLDGSVYVSNNNRIQKFDGSGKFLTKWGEEGSGDGQFSSSSGVALGPDGAVYVADSWNHRMQKFDGSGQFLMKWGSKGSADGEFNTPIALAVGPDGSVYVVDWYNDQRIQKFDSSGNFLMKWEESGSGDGEFNKPRGTAVGLDGTVYVADSYNYRVQKFDGGGKFLAKWGSQGSGDGQFSDILDVAVGPDGSVYVVDTYNYRIQKFDGGGKFLTKWGSEGSGDSQFNSAYGVAVGPDGSVYVSDINNNVIQKFDSNGKFILKWGSYGTGDGQFNGARGVAAGADGSVYVSDNLNHRIQKFDGGGKFLTKWGSLGSGDGQLHFPSGLGVGLDGSVYVADYYNDRIQKFDGSGNFLAKWGSYGSGNGQFSGPLDVAVGPDGSVYVADFYNHRIQRMVPESSNRPETLFETTIPITQQANSTKNYTTNIGTLNATGKLYLDAELTNSLGQTIAISEYPFYVVQGTTVLSFKTDKKVYKPGETVTITGKVENKSSAAVSGVTLTLSLQLSGQGPQTILTQTFNAPAKSSRPFSTTATAGSAGMYILAGKAVKGSSTLVEVKDSLEVANPKVSVTVTAPDMVGNEPFNITVEIKNEGKGEAVLNLKSSVDGKTQTITIPAGETKPVQYTHQIASDTTCTFTFTGDLEQTVTKTVLYGLSATITLNPQTVYPEGTVSVPVTLTNTGQLDETLAVTYSIQPSALTQTKTYFISKTGSVTDTIHFDLTDGAYQLTADSSGPSASGTATVTVKKEQKAELSITPGSLTNGLLPVTVPVTNIGYSTFGGSLLLSLMSNQGKVVWSGKEGFSDLSPLQSQAVGFNVNPASILPGTYTLKIDVLNSAGQQIGVYTSLFDIKGANFQIAQLPGFQTVAAGGEASFTYRVRNGGNQGGSFDLHFRASDFTKTVRTEWLNPGEEKPVTFTVTVPGDLEEKDYFADHELKAAGKAQTVEKGQVKYRVTGINLSVTASLDKQYYQQGETAQLILAVSPSGAGSTNLSARVNYSSFEDQKAFTLDGNQTLQFDIPLNKITGEKLFYGIYTETGRSIHLNSLYIYDKGDVLRIMTGKQVYNPGENVSVTIDSVGGGVSGTLTLMGPSYTDTFAFTGVATRGFTLPSIMKAGTYSVNAQLVTTTSETVTASHAFDVAGISIKVKEANLDKAKYASTDTLKLDLIVESNKNILITLRSWIISAGGTQQVGESTMNLSSSDPLQHKSEYVLMDAESGIYRLNYGIYTTVESPQPSELLLASGAEAFDVGSVMLYGLSTDKADYPTGKEPVTAIVTAYGTLDASFELELDGLTVKTETISFGGTVTRNIDIGMLNPGRHTLKAILTAGGVKSTKETTFTYAMSLLPSVKVTFRALTANIGSHTHMSEANWATVTYVKPDGTTGYAHPYDGHNEIVSVKPSSPWSYERSTSGSDETTHRWYCTDASIDGYAPSSGSKTITKNFYEQYKPVVKFYGVDSGHMTKTTAHQQFNKAHLDLNLSTSSWSDWCDAGNTLTFAQTTTGSPARTTADKRSWVVSSPFSATINYPSVKVTFRAVTANIGSHTHMSETNRSAVTYVKPDGTTGYAYPYDGHDEVVSAKPSSPWSYDRTSSGSDETTHRWYCNESTLTGATLTSGAQTVTKNFYEQYMPTVTLNGVDSGHMNRTTAHQQFNKAHLDPNLSTSPWSDWCDAGSTLAFTQTTTGSPAKITADKCSWVVSSASSAVINYFFPNVAMTFRAVTSNGGPHTDMSATNRPTVTYVKPDGTTGYAYPYDGNDEALPVKPSSKWSYSQTSSSSDTTTHRWYCNNATLTGIAPASGAKTATTITRNYCEQFQKSFAAGTPAPGTPMSSSNYVTISVYQFTIKLILRVWDNFPVTRWVDTGSTYSYTQQSTGSGSTQRWRSQTQGSGAVTDGNAISWTYYHQHKPVVTLNGTDSGYTVSTEAHSQFSTAHLDSGLYGTWTDWCDKGSTLSFSEKTTGPPHFMAQGERSWTIKSTSAHSITYSLPDTTPLDVPYYSQGDSDWCWAASVSMMLKFYGFERKLWEVAADLKKEKVGSKASANSKEVLDYLNAHNKGGIPSSWKKETFGRSEALQSKLKTILSSGHPVFLCKLGTLDSRAHAVVVTGCDDSKVYVHDPSGAMFSPDLVHHEATWTEFREVINKTWLSPFGNCDIIYRTSGRAAHGSASIQVQPGDISFKNGFGMLPDNPARHLTIEWDGYGHPDGYYYVADDLDWYHYDKELGLTATQADILEIIPYVSNYANPQSPKNRKVVVEIRSLDDTLIDSYASSLKTIPDTGFDDAAKYSLWVPEYELSNLAPGTYKLNVILKTEDDEEEDSASFRFGITSSPYAALEAKCSSDLYQAIPQGSFGVWNFTIKNEGSETDIFSLESDAGAFYLGNDPVSETPEILPGGEVVLNIRLDTAGYNVGDKGSIRTIFRSSNDSWKSSLVELTYEIIGSQ